MIRDVLIKLGLADHPTTAVTLGKVQAGLDRLGRRISEVRTAFVYMSVPLMLSIREAAKIDGILRAGGITAATAGKLSEATSKIARETGVGPAQIAEALNSLVASGQSAEEAIRNVTGAAADMSAEMSSAEKLTNMYENLALALGKKLQPALESAYAAAGGAQGITATAMMAGQVVGGAAKATVGGAKGLLGYAAQGLSYTPAAWLAGKLGYGDQVQALRGYGEASVTEGKDMMRGAVGDVEEAGYETYRERRRGQIREAAIRGDEAAAKLNEALAARDQALVSGIARKDGGAKLQQDIAIGAGN